MSSLSTLLSNDFLINIFAGFTQLTLIYIFKVIREVLIKKAIFNSKKAYLYDKRFLVLIQCFLVFFTALIILYFNFHLLSKQGITILLLVLCFILFYLIFNETTKFWSLGLSNVTSQIAKDTYSRAFKLTNNSFCLVGTNAFSFSNLIEFEQMLKRIRESSGHAKFVLADPDCIGLVEAARNRNLAENIYQNQAKISLGKIVDIKKRLGINIEIRIYNACSIDDLPIFRSMFLDDQFCIASISVYGREDHGKSFPQIFAKNNTNRTEIPKTMYNVVYRYFRSLWNSSNILSTDRENEFFEYWKQHTLTLNIENE